MNQRIKEYDILKCIGIVMVVTGHTETSHYMHQCIYYVHMALFFLLAGCTNKSDSYYVTSDNLKAFFQKRIKSLYVPFLKYSIPIILLHNFFYIQGWYNDRYDLAGWVVQIGRTLLFSIGESEPLLEQLWFVKVLFLAEMLYAALLFLLQKINVRKWMVIAPVGVFALIINCDWFPHFFHINLILPLRALLFYAVGGELWRITKRLSQTIVVLSLGGGILWFFCASKFEFVSIQNAYGIAGLLMVPFALSFFVLLWKMSKLVMAVQWIDSVVEYVGRNTMPIYFLHFVAFRIITLTFLLMTGADTAYSKNHIKDIPWLLYVIMSIAISLLIYKFFCYLHNIIFQECLTNTDVANKIKKYFE